jgi:hypothetical protein
MNTTRKYGDFMRLNLKRNIEIKDLCNIKRSVVMKRISLIIIIVLALSLTGCDNAASPQTESVNPFLGTWVYHFEDEANNITIHLTFNADMTFNYDNENYYYTTDYSMKCDGIYAYDDKELNFIYTAYNGPRDDFQRYKFYDDYLWIWDIGSYVYGGNYIKE